MGDDLFGTIGSVASGALNGLLGGLSSAWSTQKNIDLWHEQQAYNSPEAQMSRLKKAGLNPALVYGHGATATSGPAPSIGTPDVKVDIMEKLQQKVALEQSVAQTRNIAAQNALIEAQAKGAEVDAKIKERDLKVASQSDRPGEFMLGKGEDFIRLIQWISQKIRGKSGELFESIGNQWNSLADELEKLKPNFDYLKWRNYGPK